MGLKIVLFSDSPWCGSGQGRVVREFGRRWRSKSHQVVSFIWRSSMEKRWPQEWPTHEIPGSYGLREDASVRELVDLIRREQPHVVFCLGDLHHFVRIREVQAMCPETMLYGYINVDGTHMPATMRSVAVGFDGITATSVFGAQQLQALTGKTYPSAHHGVDRNLFHPLPSQAPDSPCHPQTLFDTPTGSWQDHFFLLFVGRNLWRKNLPGILEALALALPSCPDIRFMMVTNPRDPHGYPLVDVAHQLGLLGHIGFIVSTPAPNTKVPFTTDQSLNALMNRATLLVEPSLGEGFGLPILEAMSAGVPAMVSDNSAMTELVQGRGIIVPCSAALWSTGSGMRLQMVDVPTAAQALIAAYQDWKSGGTTLARYRDAGIEFAKTRSWRTQADLVLQHVEAARAKKQPPEVDTIQVQLDETVQAAVCMITSRTVGTPTVFVSKFGGLGDYVQLTPILAGIKRKHPNHQVFTIVERDYGLFDNSPFTDGTTAVGSRPQNRVAQTIRPYCDILYDVRYVSRVYANDPQLQSAPDAPHEWFYQHWAHSNARIATLGKHVVELMIESTNLSGYCSLADLQIEPVTFPVVQQLPRPYVVVHNAAGNVGHLKTWDAKAFSQVVRWLRSHGYTVVQSGLPSEPLIEGGVLDLRGRLPHVLHVASLLQQAEFYFGVEGGLFHLAKAVGTRGIVYFSITPPVCFAYPDTVVLSANACPPCWWRPGLWAEACPLDLPTCLNFPSVDEAIAAVAAATGKVAA